ncbi:MAG: B12-binding domain-containing radical SAM protein [Bacillota bacterium]
MKILLVYPKYPETFWSFKHALKFIFKEATNPPLGLLTVAALLPSNWEKRLIDMNVTALTDDDLRWADYLFLSAMVIQKESAQKVLERCKNLKVKTVVGGPLVTAEPDAFAEADYLVLNEAEITLPLWLAGLREGNPRRLYTSDEWADLTKTPVPLWDLADFRKYVSLCIQYSRGCPFECDFCDITSLYGRVPRTKSKSQVLGELESIYQRGWRGNIFIVDDNFIGNKKKLKEELLPALGDWMKLHRFPFSFYTQTSINLADDEELMRLMVNAGFDTVFIGIETPHEESLAECHKHQNEQRDLVASVKKIQRFGLQVQGGFIIGFDHDPATIFEKQIEFIQKSGIVTAMVGLLMAVKGTKLYQRLSKEQRLLKDGSGNNTDLSLNFIPKMPYDTLVNGYKKVVATIYAPENYYQRIRELLQEYRPFPKKAIRLSLCDIEAFLKSLLIIGVLGKERLQFWKLLGWSLVKKPRLFPLAVTYAIYGFHFRKVFEGY